MTDAKPVLIVGGGIAGIEIVTKLGRRLGRLGKATVTLVDRSLSHVWKPMLHTFAAGTSRPDRQKVSYLAQGRTNGFQFWPGELISIDRGKRQVSITAFGQRNADPVMLPYDALVLAIGSRANDFGTPGIAEHCETIDDLAEAEHFRNLLCQRVFNSVHMGETIDVAIVGGGATGVELAAELKHALNLLSSYATPALCRNLRLTLLESGKRLLAAFPEHISDAATRTLGKLGVDVRTGVTVTSADAAGYVLNDGSHIDAGVKVWAAGVKAPDVLARIEGLERSKSGQLVIRPTLQTTHGPAIFAVGDCSSLSQGNRPVPATAQAARPEALHISRHLGAWLSGKPMPPFQYRDRGSIVSLADYNGWGTLGSYTFGGGIMRGLSARLAHDFLYRQHQLELFGPLRGGATWLADGFDKVLSSSVRLD